MSNDITISAVIPAYNSAGCIGRAIDSVLAQTRPADEIIIVDDGSTDNTAAVVRKYGDRVRLIQQANAGAAAARNAGIQSACGQWIAFLDADDEWLPHRLAAQIDVLNRHPDLVWITGNYITCSCSEQRQAAYMTVPVVLKLLNNSDINPDFLAYYAQGLSGHTDAMLIRRDMLIEAGLYDTNLKKAEDIDLWWKIAYFHPMLGFCAEPLAVYHLGTAQSLNKSQMQGGFYADLITRHLSLAARHHRLDSFRPLAVKLLRGWMRSMLFTAQAEDIRYILKSHATLFSLAYHLGMRLLILCPAVTAAGCRAISKIVRRFNLRRRVVLPPRK